MSNKVFDVFKPLLLITSLIASSSLPPSPVAASLASPVALPRFSEEAFVAPAIWQKKTIPSVGVWKNRHRANALWRDIFGTKVTIFAGQPTRLETDGASLLDLIAREFLDPGPVKAVKEETLNRAIINDYPHKEAAQQASIVGAKTVGEALLSGVNEFHGTYRRLTDYLIHILIADNLELVRLRRGSLLETLARELGDVGLVAAVPIEMLRLDVSYLKLSIRAFNGMANADIRTVGEILGKTPTQFVGNVKNFGRVSFNEIKDKLKTLILAQKFEAPQHPEPSASADSSQNEILNILKERAAHYGFSEFDLQEANDPAHTSRLLGVDLHLRPSTDPETLAIDLRWQANPHKLVLYHHFIDSLSQVYDHEKTFDPPAPQTMALIDSLLRIEQERVREGGRLMDELSSEDVQGDPSQNEIEKRLAQNAYHVARESYKVLDRGADGTAKTLHDVARLLWFTRIFRSPGYERLRKDPTAFAGYVRAETEDAVETEFPWVKERHSVAEVVDKVIQFDRLLGPPERWATEKTTIFAGHSPEDSVPSADEINQARKKVRQAEYDLERAEAHKSRADEEESRRVWAAAKRSWGSVANLRMSPQEDPYARREVEDAQATLRKAKRDLNALLRRAGLPTVREDDRGSFFFAGESLILPVLAIYSGSMGIAKLTIALHAAPSVAFVSALVLPTWALILSWKYAVPRLMGTTRPSRTDKALLRTLRNYAAAA